jgi:hypothetical protein
MRKKLPRLKMIVSNELPNGIKSRKSPIAPIEAGHRSCSACLLHHIAMKLNRKV